MVLVSHASFISSGGRLGPISTAIRQMLGSGVLIFFSLSGFLIAGPFVRALVEGAPLPRTGAYLLRRATRIYPAYWIAFAAVLLLLWPPGGVRPYQYPVHVLLLQSSWAHAGEPTAIFFVSWTLGIEIAFYVFVPLAAGLLRVLHPGRWPPRRLAVVMLGFGLASAVWSYVVNVFLATDRSTIMLLLRIGLQVWLYAFIPGILIAIAAGAAAQRRPWPWLQWIASRPLVSLPVTLALWVLGYVLNQSTTATLAALCDVVFVVASGLLLATVVAGGRWMAPAVKMLAPIGLISYGIYLWHDIVVQVIWQKTSLGFHGGGGAFLANTILVTAITLPIAAASWFLVERPLMRLLARWLRRRRQRAAPLAVESSERVYAPS